MKFSCSRAPVCFVHYSLIVHFWPWICRKKPSLIKKSKPPFWISTMRGCKEDVRHLPRWRGRTINTWKSSFSSAPPTPSVTSTLRTTSPRGGHKHLHITSPRTWRVAELPAFSSVKRRWDFLKALLVGSNVFTLSVTFFRPPVSLAQCFYK
jgi:hypothetical protein